MKFREFEGGVVGEFSGPISRGGGSRWKFRNSRGGSWRSFPADFDGAEIAARMNNGGRFFRMVSFRGNFYDFN